MVKGKTKSGIAFEIDERIKDDTRLMTLIVKMKDATDTIEAGKALNQLLALIFGSDDNAYTFMNEVAERNEGVCSPDNMFAELTEILDSINAKKS